MEIGIYVVRSSLVTDEFQKDEFLTAVENALACPLRLAGFDETVFPDFSLIYVASGGSEGEFLQAYERFRDKPVYLLSKGDGNSLAASMEILSFLKGKGERAEILYGDVNRISARIIALTKASEAKKALHGIKLGLVGKPSDWLISSVYKPDALREKLGAEIVEITMEELMSEIAKNSYEKNEFTKQLSESGYDAEELEKAFVVYGAFCRLVEKYGLGGISVRCFDLLSSVETTGCLGLAILNAAGVYAGCEGDIPSLVSMCILGAVSGKPVFMCNPSRIDAKKGIVFAHCTLPVNMPSDMQLTTHFESGIGVAIAGAIPEGPCTVFKTSGDLSRHFAVSGRILRNLNEPTLCRTQIEVELPGYDYFTQNPIGNHHIVCTGDEAAPLEEFFRLLD